jgi:hypothetical protein
MASVQLTVQLPCKRRVGSVSAGPCLPIGELHACTRAARSPTGIGSAQVGEDLIVGKTQVTSRPAVSAVGYMQASIERDTQLLWLRLGQRLGHDEPGCHCEALILQDNLRCVHRSSYSVTCLRTIYARVAAASFTLVERKTRPRDRWRNLEYARCVGFDPRKDPPGTPVGWKTATARMIDIVRQHSAVSQKTCCPLATRRLPIFGGGSVENLVYK